MQDLSKQLKAVPVHTALLACAACCCLLHEPVLQCPAQPRHSHWSLVPGSESQSGPPDVQWCTSSTPPTSTLQEPVAPGRIGTFLVPNKQQHVPCDM